VSEATIDERTQKEGVQARGIGGRAASQRDIAASAIGGEHEMIAREGAVEPELNHRGALGDREYLRARVEAQSCAFGCQLGDVEGVSIELDCRCRLLLGLLPSVGSHT
jgi:hypothetical protein